VITQINVREVLASSVGDVARDLVTRPTGRAVRTSIEQAICAGEPARVVALDFSSIRLVDCSCADEVVAKLLQGGTVVLLRGASEHHLEMIQEVLERNGLALAAESAGNLTLLGAVADRTRAAFDGLARRGSAAAEDLAQELAWPLEEARAALDDLVSSHLALHESGRYLAPTAA
jgi:hypothetical protein